MPSKTSKIFGIGLARTGTTSLLQAFRIMGYNVCMRSLLFKLDEQIGQNTAGRALELVNKYNAFANSPWPSIFREIDAAVPNAKFILTSRDEIGWLTSMATHMGASRPEFKWIYGCESIAGNEEIFLRKYRQHNQSVRDYFAERPDKLLDLDIKQLRWDSLCPFLAEPVPTVDFPLKNSSGSVREIMTRYAVPAAIGAAHVLNGARRTISRPLFRVARGEPGRKP